MEGRSVLATGAGSGVGLAILLEAARLEFDAVSIPPGPVRHTSYPHPAPDWPARRP